MTREPSTRWPRVDAGSQHEHLLDLIAYSYVTTADLRHSIGYPIKRVEELRRRGYVIETLPRDVHAGRTNDSYKLALVPDVGADVVERAAEDGASSLGAITASRPSRRPRRPCASGMAKVAVLPATAGTLFDVEVNAPFGRQP